MTEMTLIYDGDELLYTVCAAAEYELVLDDEHQTFANWKDVKRLLLERVDYAVQATGAEDVIIALSDKDNFRKSILSTYKGNRKAQRKPLCYWRGFEWLQEEFESHIHPGLEADDVMGLMSNDVDFIVSSDKDMATIPNIAIYSPYHDKTIGPYSEDEADTFWLTQTLTGDNTDGYAGCPKVGAVGARRILDPLRGLTLEEKWGAVVEAYTKARKKESDALTQARLARILRPGEYSYATGSAILWSAD